MRREDYGDSRFKSPFIRASVLTVMFAAAALAGGAVYVSQRSDDLLRAAAQNGVGSAVRPLVWLGADVESGEGSPLSAAANNGHTGVVLQLIEAGANIHANDDLALRLAAVNGHADTVRVLLDRGANAYAQDSDALHLAIWNEKLEVARVLEQHMQRREGIESNPNPG